ncbi:39S ribosomal protein L46, mitochondrial-like isoform X2 [Tachyglossus aculeatus]|uniref:39S ribosomal protein L46, mitochondrial-like isoform X2 n=1 Tax=Tachyglossus aculeatus TaxID=9261 RepID=UPI0018F462AB|nr:39S ribosomal protein L46, mitochondrial-like isoform X2 [Tachyglossus aculeatus]
MASCWRRALGRALGPALGPRWCRPRCRRPGARGLQGSSRGGGSPWRLLGALCLQRPPLLAQPLTPLQEGTDRMLRQLEVEQSLYADHEMRILQEARRLQRRKADLYDSDDEEEDIVLAQDLEEAWEQTALRFKPGPRETEADLKNDRTSLNRKLDRNLVLLVKGQLGEQEVWLLPQAEWRAGETLRGTAERALAELSAFLQKGEGELSLARRKEGHYVWVSREELGDYLKPKYLDQVRRFFVDI